MSQPIDLADVSRSEALNHDERYNKKVLSEKEGGHGFIVDDANEDANNKRHLSDPTYPSPEERKTLRRVPGTIDILIFSIALVEFSERFSYYGALFSRDLFYSHITLIFLLSTGFSVVC